MEDKLSKLLTRGGEDLKEGDGSYWLNFWLSTEISSVRPLQVDGRNFNVHASPAMLLVAWAKLLPTILFKFPSSDPLLTPLEGSINRTTALKHYSLNDFPSSGIKHFVVMQCCFFSTNEITGSLSTSYSGFSDKWHAEKWESCALALTGLGIECPQSLKFPS